MGNGMVNCGLFKNQYLNINLLYKIKFLKEIQILLEQLNNERKVLKPNPQPKPAT